MKKILIDEDQVVTLAELAKDVADAYGWTSYEVGADVIYFKANADGEQVNGKVELSGFAYDVDSGEPIDEWNVDWDEVFDGWSDHVWAEDEDGNTVMLHN
jgi:hypothetical protein